MLLQTAAQFKCLVTFGACLWLLSCVGLFMILQNTALLKCLVTFGACKCLLSCVGLFMLLQTTALLKCLVTFGVMKWLLPCVGPFMLLQNTAFLKRLLTFVAFIILLTCVGLFMVLQTTAHNVSKHNLSNTQEVEKWFENDWLLTPIKLEIKESQSNHNHFLLQLIWKSLFQSFLIRLELDDWEMIVILVQVWYMPCQIVSRQSASILCEF